MNNTMGNAFAHVHICQIGMESAAYTCLTELMFFLFLIFSKDT